MSHATSYNSHLVATVRLCVTVYLHHYRDIANYLPKVASFNVPHLRLVHTPIRGNPFKFRPDLWH